MIPGRTNPFDPRSSTLDLSQLERGSAPAHEVLSELIHRSSSEPAISTTATAALVLSLWQLRGRALSEHVPSMILLNAGEAAPDPVDDFISGFVHDQNATRPGAKGKWGKIVPIQPEKAPAIMDNAIRDRRKIGYGKNLDYFSQRSAPVHEEHYREAKKSAYGSGYSRAYSGAWSDHFGLLTDADDGLILRLNDAPDRAAFRRDVLDDPNHLCLPEGLGRDLQMVRKTVSVSGSLTLDLWDEKLVIGIIQLGLPIVFLPHTGTELLTIRNPPAMKILPDLWRSAPGTRAGTSLMLPPIDWFEAHSQDLRRRLHLLPGMGTYEFAVKQLLHQLTSVCDQIARYAGNNHTATAKHISALFWDLHTRAFRGITLGVAALAWHCLGFDPGCPRDKAMKVLRDLRTKGSMSSSDILRYGHLKDKEQRNVLVTRLTAEGLIRIDGTTVTATTFAEFVDALHSRPELPQAENHRDLVTDNGGASA
jgi:hypothetical protein